MSELLQSAQHPDADQLTAFAEHALPAHERELTLAHLATCAHCRQLVFLAQAEEPAAVALPVAVKKPWFASWNLVWTAALAFGAIAVFSVLLRHATRKTDQTIAVVKEVPPIPVVPSPVPAVTPDTIAQTPKPTPRVVAKADIAAIGAPPAVAPVTSVNGALVQDGEFQGPGRPPGLARSREKAPPVLHGPMINQLQMPGGVATAPAQNYAQQQLPVAQGAGTQSLGMAGMAAGVGRATATPPTPSKVTLGETLRASAAAAPAPAPPKPSPPAPAQKVAVDALSDAASTVDVTTSNASALETNSAAVGAILAELPGGNATVSRASNGGRTVALDAAGAVFVSKDAGAHWQAVKTQWPGRAVLVSVNGSYAPEDRRKFQANVKAAHGLSVTHNAFADSGRAQITGLVKDQAGALIPRATIVVKSAAGATIFTTRADQNGSFTTGALDPGKYAVQISSAGFKGLDEMFELKAGDRASLDATLQVGSESTIVDVSASAFETKQRKIEAGPFVLVTDAGVTFTSTDGQKWKRR